MRYLPRIFFYFVLTFFIIFAPVGNFYSAMAATGAMVYLPISILLMLFGAVNSKLVSVENDRPSKGNQFLYISLSVALVLVTVGVLQDQLRIAAFGMTALFFSIEQVISRRELRLQNLAKRNK